VTRNIGKNLTLDTRYVGTLSRKLYDRSTSLPNFYNGMNKAFDAARGGESTLLDQMFRINIAGTGCAIARVSRNLRPVGTTVSGMLQTGAMHRRQLHPVTLEQSRKRQLPASEYAEHTELQQGLPKHIAADIAANEQEPCCVSTASRKIHQNNPQFNNATMLTNSNNTNYHSLQVQTTIQLFAGVAIFSLISWSKPRPWRFGDARLYEPRRSARDYTIKRRRRRLRTGVFELPIQGMRCSGIALASSPVRSRAGS
jgi:hypothetical protein